MEAKGIQVGAVYDHTLPTSPRTPPSPSTQPSPSPRRKPILPVSRRLKFRTDIEKLSLRPSRTMKLTSPAYNFKCKTIENKNIEEKF